MHLSYLRFWDAYASSCYAYDQRMSSDYSVGKQPMPSGYLCFWTTFALKLPMFSSNLCFWATYDFELPIPMPLGYLSSWATYAFGLNMLWSIFALKLPLLLSSFLSHMTTRKFYLFWSCYKDLTLSTSLSWRFDSSFPSWLAMNVLPHPTSLTSSWSLDPPSQSWIVMNPWILQSCHV